MQQIITKILSPTKNSIAFLGKLDKLKYVPDNTFLVSLDDVILCATSVPYALVKTPTNLLINTPTYMSNIKVI